MDAIFESRLYFLELNINKSKLLFTKEVNSLEFVEKIGDMNIVHLKNYKKRDIYLKKLGNQLSKKHRTRETQKNKAYGKDRHETRICEEIHSTNRSNKTDVLSQEEIDFLLIG